MLVTGSYDKSIALWDFRGEVVVLFGSKLIKLVLSLLTVLSAILINFPKYQTG